MEWKGGNALKAMLTPKDVAKKLNISERTVTRLRIAGKLRFKRIGGGWRINEDDLLLDIDRMQENNTSPYRRGKAIKFTNERPNYV